MSEDEDGKIDGKFPVFNDVLAFMFCKMDVSPKNTLIEAMANFYSIDELKAARDLFSKKTSKRLMQKNGETILTAIYETMQAAQRDSLPPFVAPNLNNLPCINLSTIDGASLVCKQSNMQSIIEKILEEQNVMKAKIGELEKSRGPPTPAVGAPPEAQLSVENSLQNQNVSEPVQPEEEGFINVNGRRMQSIRRRANQSTTNRPPPQTAPRRRTPRPITTGTKNDNALRVVEQIRKVRAFVSRCHPDESETEINNYVKGIIDDDCIVQKLRAKFSTYSSFVITCDFKHEDKILNPEEWPNGIIIRKFKGPIQQGNAFTSNTTDPVL